MRKIEHRQQQQRRHDEEEAANDQTTPRRLLTVSVTQGTTDDGLPRVSRLATGRPCVRSRNSAGSAVTPWTFFFMARLTLIQ